MDEKSDVNMKGKLKRSVQTLTLAMLLAYSTLLVYQVLTYELTQSSQSAVDSKDYEILIPRIRSAGEIRAKRVPVVFSVSDITPTVTATRKPPLTTLDDLFISVKTTKHYHNLRLPIILKTWFQLAKNQTWFFTDTDDDEFQQKTNGHMVNTNCSPTHSRKALCCKMSVEFDTFLESDKEWFCHFDDDNYVNVPRLVRFLADYNSQEDWYFGKTSIPAPVEILKGKKIPRKISFWFATGGAGFCVSRALALKMMPFASRGKFIRTGEKIRLPDDVTMGYIIEHLLKKPLTVVDQFHSHLEPMKFLRRDTLHDQVSQNLHLLSQPLGHRQRMVSTCLALFGAWIPIWFHYTEELQKERNMSVVTIVLTPSSDDDREVDSEDISFSYHANNNDDWVNVVKIEGFDVRYDPSRFLSLHCFLFPYFSFCPK